jgi:probable RNA-binding protein EIF1AD
MSGLGRRTHYRKHLTDSIIYDFPEPGENECLAKVVATRGSNQFDIVLPMEHADVDVDVDADNQQLLSGRESHLAILPTKFNKLVWVKRNDFVIVETADENDNNAGDTGSIRYMISHILYKDQVKHLQTKGMWPKMDAEFATHKMGLLGEQDADADADEEEDDQDNHSTLDNNDGIVYDVGYENDDFLVNTNRIAALKVDDSSEEESSDEEG